jgi:hypothetical protein
MSTWKKILVVCLSGAAVWGLAYCAGLWTSYSLVFASFAAGISALCGIMTGFTGPKA